MGLNNRAHEAILDPVLSPPVEAIVDRGRQAAALGEIHPWHSRAQNPEASVENTPIIDARLAPRFAGKMRQAHIKFENAQFVMSHVKAFFWEFESRTVDFGKPATSLLI